MLAGQGSPCALSRDLCPFPLLPLCLVYGLRPTQPLQRSISVPALPVSSHLWLC